MIISDIVKNEFKLSSNDVTAFDLFGLPENASFLGIKRMFRLLSYKYHPDKNPSRDTTEIIQTINLAYEILTSKRLDYVEAAEALNQNAYEHHKCLIAFRAYCFHDIFKTDIRKINQYAELDEINRLANMLNSRGSKVINERFNREKDEILSRQVLAISTQPEQGKTTLLKPVPQNQHQSRVKKVTFILPDDFSQPEPTRPETATHKLVPLSSILTRSEIASISKDAYFRASRNTMPLGEFEEFGIPEFIAQICQRESEVDVPSNDSDTMVPEKSVDSSMAIVPMEKKLDTQKIKPVLKSSLQELQILCPELKKFRDEFLAEYRQNIQIAMEQGTLRIPDRPIEELDREKKQREMEIYSYPAV